MMVTLNRTRWLLGIFFLCLATVPLAAQNDRVEWGLDFLGAFPKGDLEDNIEDDGLGFALYGGYRPPHSPFLVGLDLAFINYGSTSFKGPFRDCCRDLEEVETNNNIAMGHLFFRVQPGVGAIRPYFEGLVGVKSFFTTTTFREDDEFDSDTDREFDDTSVSYGGGAGLALILRDGKLRSGPTVALNIGARYLFGGETEYVVEESVEIEGTRVSYDVVESDTDMFVARVGFSVRF